MTTKERTNDVAESLLGQSQDAIRAGQKKRLQGEQLRQERAESPLIPAFVAAVAAVVVSPYVDHAIASIAVGAATGALFGWAARRV